MNRRTFLKSGTLAVGMSGVSFSSSLFAKNYDTTVDAVRDAWFKQFTLSPDNFLNLQDTVLRTQHLKAIVKHDFESGNVVDVDGLMLSKTEAALYITNG